MKVSPPERQTVTLTEVARAAGVSPSTVSRILNGTARVKDSKAAQVRQAIETLGYRPNAFARGLKTGSSGSVGVLTQDIASPFYADALRGIEDGLMGSGYSPLIISGHWRTDAEEHAVELFLSRQVEALIVLGGQLPEAELLELSRQLPVAVLGRRVPFTSPDSVCLTLDNRAAAFDLVTHLIQRGHRRIGHIRGPEDHEDAQDRVEGYRQALEDRGLPVIPSLMAQGDFQTPSGLIATQALIAAHPDMTAIFVANDQMAYGARLALHRLGLRVPEDMSLVGFDDLPLSAYTTPPLTTVRQPMYEMGEWLARFVVGRFGGVAPEPFAPRMELRLRESVATRRPS